MAGHSFSKNKQNFVLVDNNLCVENMYVRIMAIVLYLSNRDSKFILWEILFCNRIRICICIRFCISISISPPCIRLGSFRGRSTRSESGLQVFPPDCLSWNSSRVLCSALSFSPKNLSDLKTWLSKYCSLKSTGNAHQKNWQDWFVFAGAHLD